MLAQDLRSPIYINLDRNRADPRTGTVSYQPAFVGTDADTLTFLWTAYRDSRERILTSTIRGARASVDSELSPGEGVYYQPAIASTGRGAGWAAWMRWTGQRWEIIGGQLAGSRWAPVTRLSEGESNALRPALLSVGERIFAAWESDDGKTSRIVLRCWDGHGWSEVTPVSQTDGVSYRPALATGSDGTAWVFWDSYRGDTYAVYGRRVFPTRGEIQQVSANGKRSLKAVARYGAKAGLMVAWLAAVDVTGAHGVFDQWFTLQAAVLRDGRWQMIPDGEGHDAADLRHSLLPVIEPEVIGLYGYQGQRRMPMLVEDRGSVWLLWERRIVHDGKGDTLGELCGRRFDGQQWSEPVSLNQGYLDYRTPGNGRTLDGRLFAVGKGLHHFYAAVEIDLSGGRPFRFQDWWHGWEPLKLPLRSDPPRATAEIDGKKYTLYWGDLHVHSRLTADAEGEPDELMHFARDKSRIDVIAMDENDHEGRTLTEGEYRLSIYLSRRFTENGRFVALPAYEWTQNTGADNNKRNHRTVIYPGDETPIVRNTENGGNFENLCDVVEAAGGVMNTQHETFRLLRRPCEGNVEVASGWKVFIRDWPAKFHRELSDGAPVGFIATGDAHRRNPGFGGGLTGIYATELTPRAIVEALKAHRVYATNGNRTVVDARANNVFMGQEVGSSGDVHLQLRIAAPRPVTRAVLVRDGGEIHSVAGNDRSAFEVNYLDRPGKGFHWYYWRIELQGESPDYPANVKVAEGHLVWSSPHRVTVR